MTLKLTIFPRKIKFKTDQNVAELIEVIEDKKKGTQPIAKYHYTKSKTKLNLPFTMSLDYINHLVSNEMAEAEI